MSKPESETLTSDIREPVGKGDSIQKHLGPQGGDPGGRSGGQSHPYTRVLGGPSLPTVWIYFTLAWFG